MNLKKNKTHIHLEYKKQVCLVVIGTRSLSARIFPFHQGQKNDMKLQLSSSSVSSSNSFLVRTEAERGRGHHILKNYVMLCC